MLKSVHFSGLGIFIFNFYNPTIEKICISSTLIRNFVERLYSSVGTYPFLGQFYTLNQGELRNRHIRDIQQQLVDFLAEENLENLTDIDYMEKREYIFSECVSSYFQRQTREIAVLNLSVGNSFEILALNTSLVDAIIEVALGYAMYELPCLRRLQYNEMLRDQQYKEKTLPEKIEKRAAIAKQLQFDDPDASEKQILQMKQYYQQIFNDLSQDIENHEKTLRSLSQKLPWIEKCKINREFVLENMVIFARGGYGRGELSFSSDRDVGYCLNTASLNEGEKVILQQLIIRTEHLLRSASVDTAHQYFEIEDDLRQYTEEENIHTIPSILESRVLIGSKALFELLKQKFYQILSYEPYVLKKLSEYKNHTHPTLTEMNIKEDFGGLRSIQIPLWIASATFGSFPNQTADLMVLLIEKRILSPKQVYKLCQAIELVYDLRNFIGGAKEFYFDKEAEDVGIYSEIQKNTINDNMEKLYLLKRKRFPGVDDFDRFRLKAVYNIQSLSQLILDRLLDRTIVRTFSTFQVEVHLQKKLVTEIHAVKGLPHVHLLLIFNNPITILDLFIYLGNSDYDLSPEIKDELSDVLQKLTTEAIQSNRRRIREKFTELMLTPYVARALRVMHEISDPNDGFGHANTLLGRFIPEWNQMRFLLRNLTYHQYPVCVHTLKAMDRCQEELMYLKKNYPELYNYLEPKHILALKWGVLFHDVGKIEPKTKHQISGTSLAIHALERLGYDDEQLFNLITLMIAHHMTVVRLSKTTAYYDQALQRFFEVANRDLIQVILLFLVNISDYSSVSDTTAKDTKSLRNFFEEMYRVYSEMKAGGMDDPMVSILLYLRNKKQDLETDTRIDLLINASLQNDLKVTLFQPLANVNSREFQKLQRVENDLHSMWKYLKIGSLDAKGTDEYTDKLIRTIRQYLTDETIRQLTESFTPLIEWFFMAFPNRFLLSETPNVLANKMLSFVDFKNKPIIVNVLTNARGSINGVLIYVRDYPQIHSRVAYALSARRINIESGKMNQLVMADGTVGFCYYFQVSSQGSNDLIFPRELEARILEGQPPQLITLNSDFIYNSKLRLEFLEADQKSYIVREVNGKYLREDMDFMRVKITLEDAPLVYYKMARAFDNAGIHIQQSLITTIGHQVADYFYVTREDFNRIRETDFEEVLKSFFLHPTEIRLENL
ncbi:MAG: protein-PII uridylyltransferase [SAR324 cluster bacterium]|nr:protein-PII uridylyltransferase [SAR324 cluster bacterium]